MPNTLLIPANQLDADLYPIDFSDELISTISVRRTGHKLFGLMVGAACTEMHQVDLPVTAHVIPVPNRHVSGCFQLIVVIDSVMLEFSGNAYGHLHTYSASTKFFVTAFDANSGEPVTAEKLAFFDRPTRLLFNIWTGLTTDVRAYDCPDAG